jgi:hypothetical protein
MSSKTRWSRQKKIDKIIADELPKPKQPSKSKPSLPTCYEFERQFIENLTDSNGEIVLKYGMVCTTKPNKVVHRASHFSRVFAQYGGTGNPEILANLLNEAVQNIPDFKGTFVQGVGVSKRQEKSIKDYLDPIKKRLENIKKLLEIVPIPEPSKENLLILPINSDVLNINDIQLMAGTPIANIENFYNKVLPDTSDILQKYITSQDDDTTKNTIKQLNIFKVDLLKYIDSDSLRKNIKNYLSDEQREKVRRIIEEYKNKIQEDSKTNPQLNTEILSKLKTLDDKLSSINITPDAIDLINQFGQEYKRRANDIADSRGLTDGNQ